MSAEGAALAPMPLMRCRAFGAHLRETANRGLTAAAITCRPFGPPHPITVQVSEHWATHSVKCVPQLAFRRRMERQKRRSQRAKHVQFVFTAETRRHRAR